MAIEIRLFEARDAEAFAALNLAWIEEHFALEESDRYQLENPQQAIIGKGGRIVVAEIDGGVVGCGAVLPAHTQPAPGKFYVEIVKMAARADVRGQGIGRAVIDRLIGEARAMGADGIWLETARQLEAAMRLYRRVGFRPLGEDEFWPTPYSRCNSQFLLEF